jgi:hypothetical protein
MSEPKAYEQIDVDRNLWLLGNGIFVLPDGPDSGVTSQFSNVIVYEGVSFDKVAVDDVAGFCPPSRLTVNGVPSTQDKICPRMAGSFATMDQPVTIFASADVLGANGVAVSANRGAAMDLINATPIAKRPTGYWLIGMADGRYVTIDVGVRPNLT